MQSPLQVSQFDFLSNGGEMGALMRALDYDVTPLGPTESWPDILKTTLRLILTSNHPMFIWWGPNLHQFYNEAYRKTTGPERHPSALSQTGKECWSEIWLQIGPQIDFVMSGGGATWHEDQLVPVTRNGRREDVWWTYGYSPIQDAEGVKGVLVVCNDVTEEHIAKAELIRLNEQLLEELKHREQFQRHQSFQIELADTLRGMSEPAEITKAAFSMLGEYLQIPQFYFAEMDVQNNRFIISHELTSHDTLILVNKSVDFSDLGPDIFAALEAGKVTPVWRLKSDHQHFGLSRCQWTQG